MPLPIVQVDAFTASPFQGNPAAICILDAPREDAWLSAVAREMNLSETAYLIPNHDDPGSWHLRWFTPVIEVALCGHATLASAHVLWENGRLAPHDPARFHTKSGLLACNKIGHWIEMDFPATRVQPADPPGQLEEAIGAKFQFTGRSKFDYLVEVEDESTLRALNPNHHLLRQLPVRGIIVTARASSANYDFVSRFFAPGSGIDEDPVTGSAHCALAPYWAEKLGKHEMTGYQASARGGIVKVRPVRDATRPDGSADRVFLSGQAITVLRGELTTE